MGVRIAKLKENEKVSSFTAMKPEEGGQEEGTLSSLSKEEGV